MSTRSPEVAPLEAAAARLRTSPAELRLRVLGRGVTHVTALLVREGRPVAVLRLAPDADVTLPGLDLRDEGDLLQRLPATAAPRPSVLLHDPDGARLGRPGLLFEYVDGEHPQSWDELRRMAGDAGAGHALEVLLALHRSPAGQPDAPRGLDASAAEWTARLGRRAERSGAPAALTDALRALAEEPPPAAGAAWVHGDFRPSNLVVRDGRVAAVLDWEMAGWGDPARDLGIATMAAWGRWWPDAELLDRYHAGGGADIAPASLRWWRCLGYAMVVGFLAERLGAGWRGGPAIKSFVDGLERARADWEEAR